MNDINNINKLIGILREYDNAIAAAPIETIKFKSLFHEKPKQRIINEEEDEEDISTSLVQVPVSDVNKYGDSTVIQIFQEEDDD